MIRPCPWMIAGFVSERTPTRPGEMDIPGLNEDLEAQFKLDEVQIGYDQVHMRKPHLVADELMAAASFVHERADRGRATRYRERASCGSDGLPLEEAPRGDVPPARGASASRGSDAHSSSTRGVLDAHRCWRLARSRSRTVDLFCRQRGWHTAACDALDRRAQQFLKSSSAAAASRHLTARSASRLSVVPKPRSGSSRGGRAATTTATNTITFTVVRHPPLAQRSITMQSHCKKYKKCHMLRGQVGPLLRLLQAADPHVRHRVHHVRVQRPARDHDEGVRGHRRRGLRRPDSTRSAGGGLWTGP